MKANKLQRNKLSTFLGITLMLCGLSLTTMGQTMATQPQQPTKGPSQLRPLSLPHLYWHFLVYVNHLDTKSLEVDAKGKNGKLMRNYLQGRLHFADVDFAPIRTSSGRLTAEVKDVDAKAVAIQKTGASSANLDQLKALTVQREADINAEMIYLKQTLPPDKIKAFESFITQFYSPTNASPRPPSMTRNQAPAGVQK
jgi:hypothetical protein